MLSFHIHSHGRMSGPQLPFLFGCHEQYLVRKYQDLRYSILGRMHEDLFVNDHFGFLDREVRGHRLKSRLKQSSQEVLKSQAKHSIDLNDIIELLDVCL